MKNDAEFSEGRLKIMKTIDVFPIPQKDGRVMDGGDCGYCCLAGVFGYESTLAAYEAMEDAMPEGGGWKERSSMDPFRIKMFFEKHGLTYEEYNPPFDYYKPGIMVYPWNNHNWYRFFRYLIEGDKILYASVRYNRGVPPEPRTADHDHIVLINGYREWYKPHPVVKGASSLICEVRVSCSASGNRWQKWEDLLYWNGCSAIVVDMEEIEYFKKRMKGED